MASFILTEEEHEARAMLLGMEFIPVSHTYVPLNEYGWGNSQIKRFRLDADTMEELELGTGETKTKHINNRMRLVDTGKIGCKASS